MTSLAPTSSSDLDPAAALRKPAWAAAGFALAAAAAAIARVALKPSLDAPVTEAVNTLAVHSRLFDWLVFCLDNYNVFQGMALMSLLVFCFAAAGERDRLRLLMLAPCAPLAAVVSRLIQMAAPHSPRPRFDPDIAFQAPGGGGMAILRDWSSFPSDHAALLFGLALTVYAVRPRLGLAALGVAALNGFCRIYEGAHYLTDVAGGACMAGAVVYAAACLDPERLRPAWAVIRRHSALATAAGFLLAVQAGYLFDDARHVAASLAHQVLGL